MELAYIIYSLIFVVTMFCAYMGRITNGQYDEIQLSKKVQVWIWFGIAIIFYTLVLGFRENVGFDYTSYQLVFQDLIRYGSTTRDVDIIYYIFLPIVKNLHYNFFTAFLAFTTSFFVFKCFEQRMNILLLYLFFFFTFVVFLNSINIARQTSAFFILFFAINQFLNKKYKKFIAYYIIAFIVHKSCLVMLPFIFLLKYDFFKYRWLQYALLLMAFFYGKLIFGQISVGVFGINLEEFLGYEHYINNFDLWMDRVIDIKNEVQGTGLYPLLVLFTDGIAIFYSRSLKEKFKCYHINLFYNFYILGAIFEPILQFHETGMRVISYFAMYRIYIYAILFYYLFKESRNSIFMKVICIAIMLIAIVFFYVYISRERGGIAPYQFL
jgi:hypothetical protein